MVPGPRAPAPAVGGARPRRRSLALAAIAAYALLGPAAHSPVYRYVGVPVAVLATVVLIHAGYSNPPARCTGCSATRGSRPSAGYSYSLYLWHIVPMLLLEDAAPAAQAACSG